MIPRKETESMHSAHRAPGHRTPGHAPRHALVGRRRWVVGAALVVPVALVFVGCGSPETSPDTVTVSRGTVKSTVTATGTLTAIREQNLGFVDGGQLDELTVSVGQKVNAGDVLARLDDFDAQADLDQALAALEREQAVLDRILDDNTVDATEDDYEQAQDVLEATKDQAREVDDANEESLSQAKRQRALARENFERVQERHEANDSRCERSLGGDSRRRPGEVEQDGGIQGELFVPSPVESAACERARQSAGDLAAAEQRVVEADADVEQAYDKKQVEDAQQKLAIRNAERDVKAAQNEAEGAEDSRPHDIDEQRANVDDAEAEVRRARRGVDDTVLRAPVDGTIAAINGQVGEFISGGSPTTPLAPGSDAPLPDVGSGVSEDISAGDAERPGGSAFMVLDGLNTFRIVAPFEESDAAQVEPNQKVEVSFDAIPDLTRTGTVVSVAPTGTDISDVINYYVTIVLNELDPRLRDGQTAEANVVVGERDNVLTLPNAAVQRGGSTGVVGVLQPDGTVRQVQVQLGLVGSDRTQVLSGLREGQQVVIPGG